MEVNLVFVYLLGRKEKCFAASCFLLVTCRYMRKKYYAFVVNFFTLDLLRKYVLVASMWPLNISLVFSWSKRSPSTTYRIKGVAIMFLWRRHAVLKVCAKGNAILSSATFLCSIFLCFEVKMAFSCMTGLYR